MEDARLGRSPVTPPYGVKTPMSHSRARSWRQGLPQASGRSSAALRETMAQRVPRSSSILASVSTVIWAPSASASLISSPRGLMRVVRRSRRRALT